MAGFPRGFFKGLMLGGTVAVLGWVLGNRRRRTAVASRIMENVEAIPFPGSRLYASIAGQLMGGIYSAVADDIVLETKTGELLELSTGPGFLAVEMARRARDLQITAMDLSSDMVLLAENRIHSQGLGRQVKVALGDAKDIPFPDASFDYVLSLGALHHWSAPELVLAETYRVLKPGGKAWIYDLRRETPEEEWEMVRANLPFPQRFLFDVGPMASWQSAYDESQINSLATRSPFGQAQVGSLNAEIGEVKTHALTKITLQKQG